MSRCFPFPPPGYEQKAALSVEVATKEKHKSKKDKKEKRERDKKEGKEKKHREKNKEKRGEKKDRKDRDRDKNKDRDKEKDKEKRKDKDKKRDRSGSGTSNEKSLEGITAAINEGRIETTNANDSKFREELQTRIRDEKGAGRNQFEPTFAKMHGGSMFEKTRGFGGEMAPSPTDRQKRTDSGFMCLPSEQKTVGNHTGSGSVNVEQRNKIGYAGSVLEKEPIKEPRSRMGSSSLHPQKDGTSDQRNHFGASVIVRENDSILEGRFRNMSPSILEGRFRNVSPIPSSEKDDVKERRNHHTMPSGTFSEKDGIAIQRNRIATSGVFPEKGGNTEQRNHSVPSAFFPEKDAISEQRNRSGSTGSFFPEKTAVPGQNIQPGPFAFSVEKDACAEQRDQTGSSGSFADKDANKESKQKNRVQEASPQTLEKHKSKEKKSKNKDGKERHKDKEKKREKEKTKERGEQKVKEHKHTIETAKKEEHHQSVKPVLSLKESSDNASSLGVNLKRKEINGLLHENEVRPFKLQRTTSPRTPIQPHIENGIKMEYNHVTMPGGGKYLGIKDTPEMSVRLEALKDRKLGVTECKEELKVNGAFHSETTVPTSSKSPVVEPRGVINSEVPKKPPHPDTKYLNQILAVPKMAEWPEVDDQDWLFGHGDMLRKPITKVKPDHMPTVWDKTLKIEGADSVALPYVIPY